MKKRIYTIGALAKRTGMSISAIRFYADKGLLVSERSEGGTRLFPPDTLRRISFILILRQSGYTLLQIQCMLDDLPQSRTPNQTDWTKIANRINDDLSHRIKALQKLQNRLHGCIGCGCLSLTSCHLYNPQDQAANLGQGPRYLLGDDPESSTA